MVTVYTYVYAFYMRFIYPCSMSTRLCMCVHVLSFCGLSPKYVNTTSKCSVCILRVLSWFMFSVSLSKFSKIVAIKWGGVDGQLSVIL